MRPNLNLMYQTLRNLRDELVEFHDVVDGDDGEMLPNDAMRLTNEIDEVLGDTPYIGRSMNVQRLDALIDDALDYLNTELEIRHGYRKRPISYAAPDCDDREPRSDHWDA